MKRNKSNSSQENFNLLLNRKMLRFGATSITPSDSTLRGSLSIKQASYMRMPRVTPAIISQSSVNGSESKMKEPIKSLKSQLTCISCPLKILLARSELRPHLLMMINSLEKLMGNLVLLNLILLLDRLLSMSWGQVVLNFLSLSFSLRAKASRLSLRNQWGAS